MSDDARAQQIANRIDRDVASAMLPAPTGGSFNLVPRDMGQAMEFGKIMAVSGECIRPAFRNNVGACLALALQAWRDGGDPFAYANHAYIVNNQIAYEAKLVQAIVTTRAPLKGRLRTTYTGEGAKRRCKVIGYLRGDDEPFEYESPEVGTIKVKNSPLWQADPDQQLHYFSVRSWARRHVPEVLLGIYTPEEVQGEIIDMTPTQGAVQEQTAPAVAAALMWEVADATGEVYEFERATGAIEACRRILIASAADPVALATAWENNAAFLVSLGQDGRGADAQALERLYGELRPQPRETEQQEVDRHTATADHAWEIDQRNTPAAEPFATEATGPEPTAVSPAQTAAAPASSSAGHGPSATPTASPSSARPQPSPDPFWQRPSLTLDPMPVRGGGSLGKLDWRTWPALILPRIRQAWTTELINRLYQDNADHLDAFASAISERERQEIVVAFDDQRGALG